MTPKAGHTFTAGRCVPSATYPFMIECEVPGLADGYDSYVVAEAKTHSLIGRETAEANTAFIAEAFTVAHETGLTPRQLAEQRTALLKMALKVRSWLAVERCTEPLEVIDSALRGIGIAEVPCPECEGAGEWDEGPLPASSSVQISPDYRQVTCPECNGTGRAALSKATAGGAA